MASDFTQYHLGILSLSFLLRMHILSLFLLPVINLGYLSPAGHGVGFIPGT